MLSGLEAGVSSASETREWRKRPMSQAHENALSPRASHLDPTKASFTLGWTVDNDGRVTDVATSPEIHGNWGIAEFCAEQGIELVRGNYELTATPQGTAVNKMPIEIGEAGRASLLSVLGSPLVKIAVDLEQSLGQFPTDEQILEGAKQATKAVLAARTIEARHNDDVEVILPDEISGDFCPISGGCPGHSARYLARNPESTMSDEEMARVPEPLLLLTGQLIEQTYPYRKVGERGVFVVQPNGVEPNGTVGIKLAVGFIGCEESHLSGYLNNEFATRFREAMVLTLPFTLDELRGSTLNAGDTFQQALGIA